MKIGGGEVDVLRHYFSNPVKDVIDTIFIAQSLVNDGALQIVRRP